jgi:hypothetical protein
VVISRRINEDSDGNTCYITYRYEVPIKAYYHKVKLNEIKWRIDAENYLAKNKHLELQEKI